MRELKWSEGCGHRLDFRLLVYVQSLLVISCGD
jgi:hypothetical protein